MGLIDFHVLEKLDGGVELSQHIKNNVFRHFAEETAEVFRSLDLAQLRPQFWCSRVPPSAYDFTCTTALRRRGGR